MSCTKVLGHTRLLPLLGGLAVFMALVPVVSATTVPLTIEIVGKSGDATTSAIISDPDAVVRDDDTFATGGILSNDSFEIIWEATGDFDPVVSNPIAVTNLLGVAQDFTILVTLPIAPLSPATVTGGSIAGEVTANGATTAMLSSVPGLPIYQAMLDGSPFMSLLDDPQLVTTAGGTSATMGPASFGTPIPSMIGPAVTTSIGIELNFRLSAGDSAGFTSVFVAEQVPEPATCTLLGIGFFALIGAVWMRKQNA